MDPFMVSAGISAAGELFKGISGFFSGNAQAKAAKAAARQAAAEGGVAAGQALDQGNAAAAQAAVQAAANGGGFTGSSLGVIQMLSQRAYFNSRAAAYRGATEVQSHLYDARLAKKKATMSLIGAFTPAAAAIADGMGESQMAKQQQQGGATLPTVSTPAGANDQSFGYSPYDG